MGKEVYSIYGLSSSNFIDLILPLATCENTVHIQHMEIDCLYNRKLHLNILTESCGYCTSQ